MEIKAEQKYAWVSPRKVRLVADVVRELSPTEAVDYLVVSNKRAAVVVLKVLKQALANARSNFKADVDGLVFKEIIVNVGPGFKRGRMGGRGNYKPYKRRTSHIKVVLAAREEKREKVVKSAPKVVKGKVDRKVAETGEGREGERRGEEKKVERREVKTKVKGVQRRTTHK